MPVLAPMPVDTVGEVVVKAEHALDHMMIVNRWRFKITTAAAGGKTIKDWNDYFSDVWRTSVMPNLHTNYRLASITTKILASFYGFPVGAGPWTMAIPIYDTQWEYIYATDYGSVTGTELPCFTTVTTSLKTGYVGRYWSGSIHLSPLGDVAQDSTDNQQVDTTFAGAIATSLGFMATNNTHSTGNVAVCGLCSGLYWLRVVGGGVNPVSDAFSPFVNEYPSLYFSTQRSRRAPHVP